MPLVSFSRNFGHESAVAAGLAQAKGDACIVMDADLQDPPSIMKDLIEKWEEGFLNGCVFYSFLFLDQSLVRRPLKIK